MKTSIPALVLAATLTTMAMGQSVLHCLEGGRLFPVMELRGKAPYYFTGDALERGSGEGLRLVPGERFAEGFIDLKVREQFREGVSKKGGTVTFSGRPEWYLLVCEITPDRDFENCYYALSLDTFGKKSYYARPLGDLQAGKTRFLRVYVKLDYEMPDQLHIFSGMSEIRTTLIPRSYAYEYGMLVLKDGRRGQGEAEPELLEEEFMAIDPVIASGSW